MVNIVLHVFYQNEKETDSFIKSSLAAFMALILDKGLEVKISLNGLGQ